MKEYSCYEGHQFDFTDVIQVLQGRVICPYCWPHGFRNKDPERLNEKTTKVDVIV
jgi:hypothetical protein